VDKVPVERVKEYQAKLTEFLLTRKTELLAKIAKQGALNDGLIAELKSTTDEFQQTWK
jgi:F-type H+-transporting ATPase subunit alpha